MAPVEVQCYEQPISRTYQYRKVMKPLLERKRRARINNCLDELKNLMVGALQAEGENVTKLEKADVLELTVRHLQKLKRQQRLSVNPVNEIDRFRSGFSHCANEVSRCLSTISGVDIQLGTKLMTHLGHTLNEIERPAVTPLIIQVPQPQQSRTAEMTHPAPLTPVSVSSGYSSCDCDSCHSPSQAGLLQIASPSTTDVWRPW